VVIIQQAAIAVKMRGGLWSVPHCFFAQANLGECIVIQVALNGARARSENSAIPFTIAEMAESARESIAAGAGCVHFHVRGGDGRESITAGEVATALRAMRQAIPGVP